MLKDPEKRAAYDQMGSNWKAGQDFQPPPNWDAGFEFRGGGPGGGFGGGGAVRRRLRPERLLRVAVRPRRARRRRRRAAPAQRQHAGRGPPRQGPDRPRGRLSRRRAHASSLRVPAETPDGRVVLEERTLDVHIPQGHPPGQHLRLAGQGAPGGGGGPAGDLYLEIEFNPHPLLPGRRRRRLRRPAARALGGGARRDRRRADARRHGAADDPQGLGAGPQAPPQGARPAGGKGGHPGDLYVVLTIALPPADTRRRARLREPGRGVPRLRPARLR